MIGQTDRHSNNDYNFKYLDVISTVYFFYIKYIKSYSSKVFRRRGGGEFNMESFVNQIIENIYRKLG